MPSSPRDTPRRSSAGLMPSRGVETVRRMLGYLGLMAVACGGAIQVALPASASSVPVVTTAAGRCPVTPARRTPAARASAGPGCPPRPAAAPGARPGAVAGPRSHPPALAHNSAAARPAGRQHEFEARFRQDGRCLHGRSQVRAVQAGRGFKSPQSPAVSRSGSLTRSGLLSMGACAVTAAQEPHSDFAGRNRPGRGRRRLPLPVRSCRSRSIVGARHAASVRRGFCRRRHCRRDGDLAAESGHQRRG
jgi:hypothetical protein